VLGAVQISTAPGFGSAVAGTVAAIEKSTSAEVVVAVQPRQRAPRWSALVGGALLGLVALQWCLWTEVVLSELVVLVVVPVAMALGALAGQLGETALEPAAASRARTRQRCDAALVSLGAHRTRARTGVVVLVDECEGRVGLAVDAGVEGSVPLGRLAAVPLGAGPERDELTTLPDFLRGLRELGRVLADGLPADPDDNPDELDDAPRILA
jgi:uncharacterized membrane protein